MHSNRRSLECESCVSQFCVTSNFNPLNSYFVIISREMFGLFEINVTRMFKKEFKEFPGVKVCIF